MSSLILSTFRLTSHLWMYESICILEKSLGTSASWKRSRFSAVTCSRYFSINSSCTDGGRLASTSGSKVLKSRSRSSSELLSSPLPPAESSAASCCASSASPAVSAGAAGGRSGSSASASTRTPAPHPAPASAPAPAPAPAARACRRI